MTIIFILLYFIMGLTTSAVISHLNRIDISEAFGMYISIIIFWPLFLLILSGIVLWNLLYKYTAKMSEKLVELIHNKD